MSVLPCVGLAGLDTVLAALLLVAEDWFGPACVSGTEGAIGKAQQLIGARVWIESLRAGSSVSDIMCAVLLMVVFFLLLWYLQRDLMLLLSKETSAPGASV